MWMNSLTSIYMIRAVGGYVIGACEIWGIVSMAGGISGFRGDCFMVLSKPWFG